jgi:anti-anti-sigma regulatory factor
MNDNDIKTASTENGILLEVHGEFTIATCENVKTELLASLARQGNETLDLSKATHVDVIGIQLAYAWKKCLQKKHREAIVILPESENIKDLFVKTGITQIL